MIPDNDSLLSEADIVEAGIPSNAIWDAREKGILIPRKCGRSYVYVGKEVCAALIQMLPPAPMLSAEERHAKFANKYSRNFQAQPGVSDRPSRFVKRASV